VRRTKMTSMAHVSRVHQHLVRMVRVVLGHGGMVPMRPAGLLMKTACGRTGMVQRASVLMVMGRVVSVLRLALLARMRLLGRIIDIVVPYSVVARQRASDTWVPPERTALDGRRTLNGKNLVG
jgi:hypothetical protein